MDTIRFYTLLIILLSVHLSCVKSQLIRLYNSLWEVCIRLETMSLRVKPNNQEDVVVSTGTEPHNTSKVITSSHKVSWNWNNGTWQLEASLIGSDLCFKIESGEINFLHLITQPSSTWGEGIIFPLAEGHFIPTGHPVWEEFLIKAKSLNTNQDLSLPLWGIKYRKYTLHWIFTNPYNNELTFKKESKVSNLTLFLNHNFTLFELKKPFTFLLHLADPSLIRGAQRYRLWLKQEGRFETLKEKIKGLSENIFGATHIYLWGNGILSEEDVKDWEKFLKLLGGVSPFIQEIFKRLNPESKELIKSKSAAIGLKGKLNLIRDLNQVLNDCARENWQKQEVDYEKLTDSYPNLKEAFFRHVFTALHPTPARWGGGLSIKIIEKLQMANLTNLWLGLGEGWEDGLWHPEAVTEATKAGYLIAPYDSYETSLSPGSRPDWITAHMGESVHKVCGIQLKIGERKKGFQGHGFYTNPVCIRPTLQERITILKSRAGFNSWFLDSYASGMLFDDFNPNFTISKDSMAEENIKSIKWISSTFKLVLGSEGGNAVTSGGIIFAHGMQTPVIGWDDPDHWNSNSTYHLGNWYPSEEPTIFFKSVRLKAFYKTVHFEPQYRLPLYQAVFHDSIITTHHWHYDNLKLVNVEIENILTGLLYNVPPLFHLNLGTISTRLMIIKRIDNFFKPLHQRLATQALTGFQWIDAKGKIQMTNFSDGTCLIANFEKSVRSYHNFRLPAYSVTALILRTRDGESLHRVEYQYEHQSDK